MSGSAKAGTTAERHTCELQVLAGSAVRAPPKARVRRIFFSLDKRLTWMSGLAENTHSIFCDGPHGPETVNGCPVLRRQEPPPRGTRASCRFWQVRQCALLLKRASGESFSSLTRDLHGRRQPLPWDYFSVVCDAPETAMTARIGD